MFSFMRSALVMVSLRSTRTLIRIRTIFPGDLKSSHDDICGRWCPRSVILLFKVFCCKLLEEYCSSNLLVFNSSRDCLESCNLWWSEACLYAVLLQGWGMPLILYFSRSIYTPHFCPSASVYSNSAAFLSYQTLFSGAAGSTSVSSLSSVGDSIRWTINTSQGPHATYQ